MADKTDKAYHPPRAWVGMECLWFHEKNGAVPGLAAKVTKVGAETLNLAIFYPDLANLMHKDGVRHVSDPRVKDGETFERLGFWDYTEGEKRLEQFFQEMAPAFCREAQEEKAAKEAKKVK